MRFPLPMTTRIAGYVARKRLVEGQEVPHGSDARAAARLQLDVHRLRPDSRIRIDDQAEAVDRRVPGRRRRVRRTGRLDLRRRADDLPAASASWWPRSRSGRRSSSSAPTGCSSARSSAEFKPSRTFFFNVHLDGMRKNHDIAVEREGVFDAAIDGIKAAKEGGFLVCTNTTIFKETDMAEIDTLFAYLTTLDVDGFIISPAYSYAAVNSKEIFMTRDDIKAKFRAAEAMFRKYQFHSSPIYQEFLQGKREMQCTAWASPTRNIKGWKGPCYLITDIHHDRFADLLNKTAWEKYGYGKDPRCENCMVHVGYETVGRRGRQQPPGRHAQDDQVAAL